MYEGSIYIEMFHLEQTHLNTLYFNRKLVYWVKDQEMQ